jgi:hypothetical protein
MTNIYGAINSKQTKIYGVTKTHGLPWKFVTPCYQMACHIIITWKTELLLITKDNNIFNFLINEINSSNQWHESWCEISVTCHEVLRLINLVWHAKSHHMTINCYYWPKVERMSGLLLLPNFGWLKIHFWKFDLCVKTIKSWYRLQPQNGNVMWHHNVFYCYTVIIMNL